MTHVSAVDINRGINTKGATYNAIKIQVNNPTANIPAENNNCLKEDNSTYNGVAIEVNNPTVNKEKHHHCIYDYPQAECPICAEMAGFYPIKKPSIPVAYQTNNFINNRTLINAEVEVERKLAEAMKDMEEKAAEEPEEGFAIVEEKVVVAVPEPNVTTTEAEKSENSEVTFNGLSFKADKAKKELEIVEPKEIKPDVDINKVVSNLANNNYDIPAKQMEEIARISMKNPKDAVPFIVTEVFSELINIVEKDTKNLTPPTEKQIEIRKQIIVNEIVKEQAKAQKTDESKIEVPYKIEKQDLELATSLSPLELAERNKEYALYTMAILAKVYTDEVHKQTGNIVPLTDLPGVAAIVDTLRNNSNAGVKIAAIDALRYINRPEYQEELKAVLELAADDKNPYVARNAAVALESMN